MLRINKILIFMQRFSGLNTLDGKAIHTSEFIEKLRAEEEERTESKVFIPNKVFDEEIEMGDSVWVYMGENYEAYCIYWPQE